MKNEKAKQALRALTLNKANIDHCIAMNVVNGTLHSDIERIVELAEQEAEERMRQKAIKAHRACCPLNELQCIHRDRDDYTCTYDCRYVTSFIQKLNEE